MARRRAPVRSSTPRRPEGSVNPSDLKGLRAAWREKQLVLCLGAGVSLAYGIPSWKNLVLEMLFDQTEHAGRMRAMYPNYRRALSSWLADYFEYSPVVLARMIEDDLRRRSKAGKGGAPANDSLLTKALRTHLYRSLKKPTIPTTLSAIADFVAAKPSNVPAIITFNFDDLLEQELSSRRVEHVSVSTSARQERGRLRILHPHGLVPQVPGTEETSVIFTERHYHALTETVFHWALTEIVHYLRHYTVLFIGLSMSDPNLRRLLDACRNSKIPPHWQIQKRHEIRDHERTEVAQDVERRARTWGAILGEHYESSPDQLVEVVNATLRQADTYDRELFESMGVKTIWIEDFADIEATLRLIRRRDGP